MTKTLGFAALALAAFAGCAHDTPSPSSFEVVAITPADGSASVATTQTVQVQFNKDVHPDAVASGKNILVIDSRNRLLRGSFTVTAATVTFTPTGGFGADETFGVAVLRTVFDLNGVPLRFPRAVQFSTGTAVEPIEGFPPFDEFPLAPDASKIVAEIRGAQTQVAGSSGAVEAAGDNGPLYVNARNSTAGGEWITVAATSGGSFLAILLGGDPGDVIEVSASYSTTWKTGPSSTVVATYPFSWGALAPAGTAPSARHGHTAVLDSSGGRMIVFGGCTNAAGLSGARNDAFALALQEGAETWVSLSPQGVAPSARFGHTAVVDAARNRMIVFGGDSGALGVLNDVWALSLAPGSEAWTLLNPTGTPPAARAFHAAVFDAANKRMIVIAGRGAQGLNPPQYGDAFALNLPDAGTPSWALLAPSGTGPIARNGLFAVADAAGTGAVAGFGLSGIALPDTYTLTFSGPAWAPILSVPSSTGRAFAAAVLDSGRTRILLFGGRDAATGSFDDLFAYDLGAGSWSTPTPEGSAPSARFGATFVYDAAAGRSLLFGGADLGSVSVFNDLRQLR